MGVCPAAALELVETWIEVSSDDCTGCGRCTRICPLGALELVKEAEANP